MSKQAPEGAYTRSRMASEQWDYTHKHIERTNMGATSRLTTNQWVLLESIVDSTVINGALTKGLEVHDGNARRTVRSLIRRGFCEWWPRNTHREVIATRTGKLAVHS